MKIRVRKNWTIIAIVAVLVVIAGVIPVAAIPNADFTGTPLTGPKPLNVQFTDASTGNGTLTYAWNFGDGNTSILKNPSHTYYTAGSYTVNLTVTDDDGPDNSSTKTQPGYITVNEAPPVAAFSGTPTSGPKPLNVQFTDASTGVIATYSWNFGDGNSSILKDPSHTYYTVGSYTVNLTVTGPGGSDFENKTNYITVGEAPPVAGFSATPTSGPRPLNVAFSDASTGVIATYAWDFGDGNSSILKDPSNTYYTVGSYTVNLTVTGPGGSDFENKTNYITVGEAPPVAGFSATPTSGPKPLNVQFTDASTGVIATYSWNFGDGNSSILKDPSHTYYTVGSYTVNLTVTGPGGSDFENKINHITITNATTKIGIYKDGIWYLDRNGNGGTGASTDKAYGFGATGWTPVVGKWTADGISKIGIFNAGNWYIDPNGDGQFIPSMGDKYIPYGAPGWTQLAGDWNGDGKSEIGIYKDAVWYLDYGGSGVIDANTRYYQFGAAGWTPIIGDWNGDKKDEIGIYQDGNWYLDYNGNGVWDTGDLNYGFGTTGWTPVVGKWTADGISKIGIYNAGNWYIDLNGDGQFIPSTGDKYIPYGAPGWTQLVGDWNGDGKSEIGIYKDAVWYLDYGGSGAIDANTRYYQFGAAGWTPIIGDWNGDKKDKIGVYQNGNWYLDYNGDGVYTTGGNTAYTFRGEAGWTPLVGDWNGNGTTKIGVYKAGTLYLDYNGNGAWDTPPTDKGYNFGLPPDYIPVVGDWNGDGRTKAGFYRWGFWSLDYYGQGNTTAAYSFIQEYDYNRVPVVGDWNGDRKTETGVYNNIDGAVNLDYNGNGDWDAGLDVARNFNVGYWTPVTGDWNGDGKSKMGVFKDGSWHLDYYGNGSLINVYSFGATGSKPITGDWNGDGKSKVGVYNSLNGDWNLDYDGNGVWDATADKVYNIGVGTPVVGKWS